MAALSRAARSPAQRRKRPISAGALPGRRRATSARARDRGARSGGAGRRPRARRAAPAAARSPCGARPAPHPPRPCSCRSAAARPAGRAGRSGTRRGRQQVAAGDHGREAEIEQAVDDPRRRDLPRRKARQRRGRCVSRHRMRAATTTISTTPIALWVTNSRVLQRPPVDADHCEASRDRRQQQGRGQPMQPARRRAIGGCRRCGATGRRPWPCSPCGRGGRWPRHRPGSGRPPRARPGVRPALTVGC